MTECHSTSSLFRGYSRVHEGQGPARRAASSPAASAASAATTTPSARCTRRTWPTGSRPRSMAEWIVNLGEAAEYMFDHTIFQDNLVFVDFCEAMVRQTNPSVLAQAENDRRAARRRARLRTIADIMRAFNPFEGEVYKEALKVSPGHARDVLPDGGPARPSVDALSRRRRHDARADAVHRLPQPADRLPRLRQEGRRAERRRLRLLLRGAARLRGGRPPAGAAGLLGRVPGPRGRRLPLRDDDRLGPGDVRDARASSSTGSCSPRTWWTSTSGSGSCSAAPTTRTG